MDIKAQEEVKLLMIPWSNEYRRRHGTDDFNTLKEWWEKLDQEEVSQLWEVERHHRRMALRLSLKDM